MCQLWQRILHFCNVPAVAEVTNGTLGTDHFPVAREKWEIRAYSGYRCGNIKRGEETKLSSLDDCLSGSPEERFPNQPLSHLSLPFCTQDVKRSFHLFLYVRLYHRSFHFSIASSDMEACKGIGNSK